MNKLKPVKVGWKALEGILNGMISAINQRGVTTGAGLSFQETDNGKLIWVTKLGDDNGQTTSDGSTGTTPTPDQPWLKTPSGTAAGWQQVDIMDANCNRSTIYVWGGL